MAILTSLKNKAAGAAASQVSSFARAASGAAKSINPLGGLGGSFNSNSSPNLTYPIGVESDPGQGHYIIFYVYEISDAKIKKDKAAAEESAHWDFGGGTVAGTSQFAKQQNEDAKPAFQKGSGAGKSLSIKRPAMRRMDQAISLYMPASVEVKYKSNFSSPEIGLLAQTGADVYNKLKEGKGLGSALMGGIGGMATGALVKAVDTAQSMAPGAKAMAQIVSGKAITNKMELQFDGVGRRDFAYTFSFIPKSEQEAQIVEQIVYSFKKNMLPSYWNGALSDLGFNTKKKIDLKGKIMNTPNLFDIEYRYMGDENPFLNKISTCYLTDMSVKYGGDRYKTYEPTTVASRKGYELSGKSGPPPQKTEVTLNFSEMEIITRERIEAGF